MNTKTALVVTFSFALALAGGPPGIRADGGAGPAAAEPAGARLGVFEARWPKRLPAEVATRAHAVAQVLLERKDLSLNSFMAAAKRHAKAAQAWGEHPSAAVPYLHVEYDPRYDDLRLANTDLADELPFAPAIGEAAARERFEDCFERLAAAGIVKAEQFDLAKVDVGYTKFGMARGDLEAVPEITEYRFGLLRQVNGIDFANAGVRISVHRTGGIASIRVGGAEVAARREGTKEQPLGRGGWFQRAVSRTEVEGRFSRDVPNARTAWSRLMYVMPENVDTALIEPLQVISHSRVFEADGRQVVSRRQVLAYSLRTPGAPPLDLSGRGEPQEPREPR
ncbi:MAG TPA: hypothetical protein VGG03_08940 [Thermoanaerobaculia bacterium]|jgi:hypothetical protein